MTRNVNPSRPFFTLTGAISPQNSSLFSAELRHYISKIAPVFHRPAVSRSGLYSLGFIPSARALQTPSYPLTVAACAAAERKLDFTISPRPERRAMPVVPVWVFSSSLTLPYGEHRIGTVVVLNTGRKRVKLLFPVSRTISNPDHPFLIPAKTGFIVHLGCKSSARRKPSFPLIAITAVTIAAGSVFFIVRSFPFSRSRAVASLRETGFASTDKGTAAVFRTGKAGVSKNFQKFPVSKDYSARPFSIPSLGFRSENCTSVVNSFCLFSAWPRPSYPLTAYPAVVQHPAGGYFKVRFDPRIPKRWSSTVSAAGFAWAASTSCFQPNNSDQPKK